MLGLYDELSKLAQPIRVGVIGIGSIGRGIALQANLVPGTTCTAIANRTIERAIQWAEKMQVPFRVVDSPDAINDCFREGILAVCEDGNLISSCDCIDVVVEATNAVYEGAKHAMMALDHDKDVVMMNHEADLMYGPLLLETARRRNRIYTVCDGDQPAAIKRLVDEIKIMGFHLVMAGNIKGFLNQRADPTSIIPEADKRNLDPRTCVSFTDGTKLGVEMAVVANGIGLRTAVPGMYGPRLASLHDVLEFYDFDRLWDGNEGFVDYVLGPEPKGGVFAVGYTDVPHQNETLGWFPVNIGKGPFYLFYRPYHLGHFESMATVAEVILHRRPVLVARHGFLTNVFAYAKTDLRAGQVLDGAGGYTCYGLIDNYGDDLEEMALPICVADGVTLTREVSVDKPILFRDVIYDAADPAINLHFQALGEAPFPLRRRESLLQSS